MSVVIPCFNERRTIAQVLKSLLRQKSADGSPFQERGEIIVVNDASTDDTGQIVAEFEKTHSCVNLIRNERNLGLAGSLNRGIQAAAAPLLLSCQGDCHPLDDHYVHRILEHFRDEKVAVVTGKPVVLDYESLSLAEKAYILLNIMDVEAEGEAVREINFAEGRCDALRKSALLEAGSYNERVRLSGEDQLMAIRLRERGYRVIQDTSLVYSLAAGGSQNTVRKVIRHQVQLAQGMAFILSRAGLNTARMAVTSVNRVRRRRLRVIQITFVPLSVLLAVILGFASLAAIAAWLLGIVVLRWFYLLIENRGRFGARTLLRILPIALACDTTYCWAFYRGLWRTWRGKSV